MKVERWGEKTDRGKLRGYGGGKRQERAPEEVRRVERDMHTKKPNEIDIQNEQRGKDKQ